MSLVISFQRNTLVTFLGRPKNLFLVASVWSSALLPAAAQVFTVVPLNSGIQFGSFVVLPSCANCTITVSTAGVRTASAGVLLATGGAPSAASFTVSSTGANNNNKAQYTVIAPVAATPAVNMAAGGVTMTVGTFTSAQAPVPTKLSPTNTLFVGATLTIPNSGATAGNHSTSFNVTTNP